MNWFGPANQLGNPTPNPPRVALSQRPASVSTNGSNRPNSQTWHRLAVWTVGALVAGIHSKTRV